MLFSISNHKVFCRNLLLTFVSNKYQKLFLRTKPKISQNLMTNNSISMPDVRGMMHLDREKFRKSYKIPIIDIGDSHINTILPHLKNVLFKINHFKPVQSIDSGLKRIYLHPNMIKCPEDLSKDIQNLLQNLDTNLQWTDLELTYDNWKAEDILKAILPEHQEGISSYSRIGHIIHVNLRDHLLPYKQIIGEVIKEKTVGCRTVVNKSQTIENTYRVFQMELLCGDSDYLVDVKENGIQFKFDFSNVYWNPRLASEHERIIKMCKQNDVLYDVFAGVGPFSIPIGKRKCFVHANDLNPDSYRWLNHNVKQNKVTSFVQTYNKDGRDFIQTDVRDDLLKRWQCPLIDYSIHITMNLPSMAVEFLDAFYGIFNENDRILMKSIVMPMVHVYCFAKTIDKSCDNSMALIARKLVESYLIAGNFHGNLDVHFVRNVAPNKDMYRVSFQLTEEILFVKCTKAQKRKASSPDLNENHDLLAEKIPNVINDK